MGQGEQSGGQEGRAEVLFQEGGSSQGPSASPALNAASEGQRGPHLAGLKRGPPLGGCPRLRPHRHLAPSSEPVSHSQANAPRHLR